MKCKALSLLCNREYAYREINGDCQGDWQDCYYPKDEENLLDELEMQYFNTGEEWEVVDAEELKEHGLRIIVVKQRLFLTRMKSLMRFLRKSSQAHSKPQA